ncbi:MAG: aminotransferase class III-fold pyridoxal phosphate-dependent enzyme [Pseudomonadota bacterium]
MYNVNPARARLLETFALDAAIVEGDGCRLVDSDGREHLDCLAQYGALPFGHNPPRIWDAIAGVRDTGLPAMLQPLRALEAERLAERLAEITPGDLSITTFANSGAEAVEAAIKLARVRTGRDVILSTSNGFHGKTLGALSATGKPMYQKDFAAPAPGFEYIPYGDLAALEAKLEADGHRIAAFVFEPIQGEGGIICPPDGYLDAAIALCRKHGVLSVADEIQTGLGRTGDLFACAAGEETPDLLLLAKALGGGLMPIAACIATPEAWDDRFGRLHSSTFANNNLACAAANAALDLLLEDDRALVRRVAENGRRLRQGLEALQRAYPEVIREVRGRGYLAGLEFHGFEFGRDSATMAFASLNGGATALISSYLFNVQRVLTAPLFNSSCVLRLQPPLVAGMAEIERLLAALDAACGLLQRRDYAGLVRHLVAEDRAPLTAPEGKPADAAPRRLDPPEAGRFAFLIHYTEEEDLFRSDPSFRNLDARELGAWREWIKNLGPGFARPVPQVTSRTGATAEGMIMSVPMLTGDMMGKGRHAAAGMVKEAVDMAREYGASRLGLGAFTSIVTRGGSSATGRGVPITSGNTLTTVAAVEAIERTAARVGLDLEDAHVAVVGASGAIGRLGALMLARRAGRLTLVGNQANAFAPRLLSKVADEALATLADDDACDAGGPPGMLRLEARETLRRMGLEAPRDAKGLHERFSLHYADRGQRAPLECSVNLREALSRADVVLVATSSEVTLVDPRELREGALVCDVARPPNVAHADLRGSGVLVFDGGVVRPPSAIDLGPFRTLPEDQCWGCLGETMLLALARETRDYSIGASLPLEDADHMRALAARHGFEPSEPQWYGERIDDLAFGRFAAVRHARRRQARLAVPSAGPVVAAE